MVFIVNVSLKKNSLKREFYVTFKWTINFIPFWGFRSNLGYSTVGLGQQKYLLQDQVLPNSAIRFF